MLRSFNYGNYKVIIYTGLIACEVDAAAEKRCVANNSIDKNVSYWGIGYGNLTFPLT